MKGKVRTFSRCRGNRNPPAKALNGLSNHIHADAASRHVRHSFRSRKARGEDQVVDFIVTQLCIRLNDALVHRQFEDFFAVDTGAVIANFDNDASRTVGGREDDFPLFRLAKLSAFFDALNTMVDRIADHVGERI